MTYSFKASLFAAVLASTGMVAAAQAQTPATPGTATPGTTTAPAVTAAPATTPVTPMTSPTMGTPPAAMGTRAAPHGAAHTNSAAPAAVSTTTAPSRTTAAPVAGANSFTEGEARRRIQAKGFGQVTDLKKDDKGVWRGMSTKDGKATSVALDYQGNVVSQ